MNLQREGHRTHLDVGAMRKLRRIRQHAALVGWIFMKDIDARADQGVGIETGPQLAEMLGVFDEHLLAGFVGVGDLEVAIREHDRARNALKGAGAKRLHGGVRGLLRSLRRFTILGCH